MVEITGDPKTIAGFRAGQYISSIHNDKKKAYARSYLLYILQGRTGATPPYGDLSAMAAQAVRMRLDEIFAYQGAESQ
jgi:hypothetical protein